MLHAPYGEQTVLFGLLIRLALYFLHVRGEPAARVLMGGSCAQAPILSCLVSSHFNIKTHHHQTRSRKEQSGYSDF